MSELRHYTLPIGAVVLVAGTIPFILSLIAGLLAMPEVVTFYVEALPRAEGRWQGWNTVVFLVTPFVMLVGGWYVYEQVSLRQRFNELVQTRKKSAFVKEVDELERISRRLPPRFRERLQERKDELNV